MNMPLTDSAGTPTLPRLPDSLPWPAQPAPELAGQHEDPGAIPFPGWRLPPFRFLRNGCYLLNYQPAGGDPFALYDGTLRVDGRPGGGVTASGDLYQRQSIYLPLGGRLVRILLAPPNPADGIPVLPRNLYRYYLSITQILETITLENHFTLGFEMFRFQKTGSAWSAGGTWHSEGTFTATMTWQTAPAGYPAPASFLAGDVRNAAGTIVGRLTMGHVSNFLRKATLEVDRVSTAEQPLNNDGAVSWITVGRDIGWDLTVIPSDMDIAEPSGESWSEAECHARMLARRDSANLDREWRYHLLCVRKLDSPVFGVMYDNEGTDSNNVPREGCVVAAHVTYSDTPQFGLVRGMRAGTAPAPFFRTAVHEWGHAVGLYHIFATNTFMRRTVDIAADSLSPGSPRFPNNITWSFSADDTKRLKHMPDVYVRPGGLPFGTSFAATPISPDDAAFADPGLTLQLSAVVETLPLGAPVRIDLELRNTSDHPVSAPATLRMKSGQLRGRVIDPGGTARSFSPVLLLEDEVPTTPLEPNQSRRGSLTLLRGSEGALFPMAGVHRIVVEVSCEHEGGHSVVSGETFVMVTPAVDEAHAKAALKMLTAPDALLTLVFGGDHLPDGVAAFKAALDTPVLRPHVAYIEAKRLATRFGQRRPDLRAAAELIDDTVVMSSAEVKKAAILCNRERRDSAARQDIANALKSKLASLRASDEVKEIVEQL